MKDDLLEAWRTNNRINLFLIDRISHAGMLCTLSKHGGSNVALQFTHMQNNRVWHLEKRTRDLGEELTIFPSKITPTKTALKEALSASSAAMEAFLGELFCGDPKRRGFKKSLFSTLACFVAPESHHRGNTIYVSH